jgi:hypothetical protein
MVVRSAQKDTGDVQRIREAMESNKPVVTTGQRELIIRQASITGEDGASMIEEIEEAAANNKMLPADVFRVIDQCMTSLSLRATRRVQADRMVAEKEPERLKQIEAIREQATMLHTCRLNRDRVTEECVAKTMREAVIEYVAAVDRDIAEGLDPDAAREWKERAQEIVTLANLDMPAAGTRGEEPALVPQEVPAPSPQEEATDHLAPLKDAIEQARLTANAANRELNDPEETVLRGFGKQLGGSRKEILALSRNLVVGQPAGVAAEAARLADEACENIRVGRELIRAALRDMGAASDISEASGPVRARPAAQGGPPVGRRPTVPMPVGPQRPPPPRVGTATPPSEVGLGRHAGRLGPPVHTGQPAMGATGIAAAAKDKGGGQRTNYPHEGYDECSSKRRRMAHVQREVRRIPTLPQRMVGIQADLPRARARRAGVPHPEGEEPD